MDRSESSGQRAARTGVLGGTFDPIHVGHLVIAQEACYSFALDKVVFVPARQQPLKPDGHAASAEDRYRMTLLATEGNSRFEVSHAELERPGPSFTVDTLEQMRRAHPEAELFFIAGLDAVLDIESWHEPERILEMCRLIAASRPGYDMSEVERTLPPQFLRRILFLEAPEVCVSSTELRARIADGAPISYLVPREVEDYITQRGLYRTADICGEVE